MIRPIVHRRPDRPQVALAGRHAQLTCGILARMVIVEAGTFAALEATLDQQRQVVTRRQLNAAGVDHVFISRRIRRGLWLRLLPGVYAVDAAPVTTEQRRIAASLYAGSPSQLTGLNALHWYGFRYAPATDRIHVLVPHETRRRSAGFVVVQRTRALDDAPRDSQQYRIVSPARAVVDACRALADLGTVRAIVAEAVQGGHTSLDALDREIRRAARSRTALVRHVFAEIIDGVRSSPEAELRALAATSTTLPAILWNTRLRADDGSALPTPDGWIAEAGIALEVDSREHHSSPDDWARTLQRHNILSQYGALILHFTPKEIRTEPARVLRVMERTYLSRMQSPISISLSAGAPY